ncbi:MAG: hypothetical protein LBP96_01850 [Bacteroidales bacterium]|nr:hypothetical protein [Bacteroidales bacterium]
MKSEEINCQMGRVMISIADIEQIKLTEVAKWVNALTKEELLESIRIEMKTWNWKNGHKILATG